MNAYSYTLCTLNLLCFGGQVCLIAQLDRTYPTVTGSYARVRPCWVDIWYILRCTAVIDQATAICRQHNCGRERCATRGFSFRGFKYRRGVKVRNASSTRCFGQPMGTDRTAITDYQRRVLVCTQAGSSKTRQIVSDTNAACNSY